MEMHTHSLGAGVWQAPAVKATRAPGGGPCVPKLAAGESEKQAGGWEHPATESHEGGGTEGAAPTQRACFGRCDGGLEGQWRQARMRASWGHGCPRASRCSEVATPCGSPRAPEGPHARGAVCVGGGAPTMWLGLRACVVKHARRGRPG